MKLSDFVVNRSIVVQFQNTDRDGVIHELVDALVKAEALPASLRDDLIKMIIDREKHGSTGFGKGVAVPHVKHKKVRKMVAAVGVCEQGIEFNALDRAPVYSVVLLASPDDRPDEHLEAMETIFSHLQNDTFRRFLRQSNTVEEVWELLQDADAEQLKN